MDNIAGMIDHTLLRPEAPLGAYTQLVREAVEYNFASVCVNPFHVPLVSNLLNIHPTVKTKTCSVISFPFGASDVHTKSIEIERAISKGAKELDVVVNLSLVKTGEWKHLKEELVELREASDHYTLKLILEVAALTDDEIKHCCDLSMETNLDFVKTSTGFFKELKPLETARYVKLMKESVAGSRVKVKASGWIRTLADFNMVVEAGASRVGCSKSIEIMQEFNQQNGR
jgi:deoxyribose-phosphate aldolase